MLIECSAPLAKIMGFFTASKHPLRYFEHANYRCLLWHKNIKVYNFVNMQWKLKSLSNDPVHTKMKTMHHFQWKHKLLKTLSRVERFENATVSASCGRVEFTENANFWKWLVMWSQLEDIKRECIFVFIGTVSCSYEAWLWISNRRFPGCLSPLFQSES